MAEQPFITDSARKHGIVDDDMLHAFRNPIRVAYLDELTMTIGTAPTGALLEVGWIVDDDGDTVIIHAMPARPQFLR